MVDEFLHLFVGDKFSIISNHYFAKILLVWIHIYSLLVLKLLMLGL